MLTQAIGDLLPSALGVALSPVPIIAVILMLGTPQARTNGPAFAVGWVGGLVIVSVVVLLVTGDASEADSGDEHRDQLGAGGPRCAVPRDGRQAVAIPTEARRESRDAQVDGHHRHLHTRQGTVAGRRAVRCEPQEPCPHRCGYRVDRPSGDARQ